ncbi:MAG: GNAT family N-acetyltransferase [Peptostreptococcaceae bacterium]
MDKKILECELEYYKCFSHFYENESIIRFRDNDLKDMYDHNFTFIKERTSKEEINRIIESEIELRKSEKASFFNIHTDISLSDNFIKSLKLNPTISNNGYYIFDVSKYKDLKALKNAKVKKLISKEMVEDLLYCDLEHDEKTLGAEFCQRRCYRRSKVYLSEGKIDSYICYDVNGVIGNCDLFIHNKIAKIEDFAVIPKHQRKGYGTIILKSLIDIAINKGCEKIYLLTDEDDSAKEMYSKLGFSKIGERTDLFYDLNKI